MPASARKAPVLGVRGGHYANEDQKKMHAIWRTKEWKARVQELLLQYQRCQWCNGKSGVVNHRRQGYYEGYELCRREEVDIICQPCHQEWTKTGQQRPRLYDDCDSCEAPVFKGRKVCFMCGSKNIISKADYSPEEKARFLGILDKCPEVREGDVWQGVWAWPDEIQVRGFEKQDLPWPLVKTSKGEVGLPAFMFGERTAVGAGLSWKDLSDS